MEFFASIFCSSPDGVIGVMMAVNMSGVTKSPNLLSIRMFVTNLYKKFTLTIIAIRNTLWYNY